MNIQEYHRIINKPKRHKYNAKATVVDGIWFASKAEARRYCELKMEQQYGYIKFFLRQVPFHLPGNIRYVCDFMVFHRDGGYVVEDVKGKITPQFVRNKKQVKALYGINIKVIK